jgi:hypothetical protein
MTDSDPQQAWPADWAAVSREQRRAWRAVSPDTRLRWLEDALTFAQAAGALTRDRDRRADAARSWASGD